MHEERARVLRAELDRFVDIVSRELDPERIVLFGSFAHGEAHEWSDLDLVVVAETELLFLERQKRVMHSVRPTVSIDFFVYTPSEWDYMTRTQPFMRDEIAAKGKIVYERRRAAVG